MAHTRDQALGDVDSNDAARVRPPARVFISYKRNEEPDETVALRIYETLSSQHTVFMDQKSIKVGEDWAKSIDEELNRADFLICLLSASSVQSEMVVGELVKAHHLWKVKKRPVILPVRIAFGGLLPYPLSAYLDNINWALWASAEDTPRLIYQLIEAMSGGGLSGDAADVPPAGKSEDSHSAPLPVAQLEMPEGTMGMDARFYVERSFDADVLAAVRRSSGVTVTIKGPRQMGKSSLLIRAISAAAEAGKRVTFLDFQLFDKAALADADLFFRQFCAWLTDALELEDRVEQYWRPGLSNGQLCTRYVLKHILQEARESIVLALDEVDSIFESDFRSDFFGMLRSWHNYRAYDPNWRRLDLALVTSTEPYQLIENLHQSPFNVGEVIELTDFDSEHVADLNRRHGSPLASDEGDRLRDLLHGHPYLVRRALYLIASGRVAFDDLISRADDDRGPFGDHLRYHLFRLHNKPELVEGLRQVIRHNSCRDELIFHRLHGAGLVRREGAREVPRCPLYEMFFRRHIHG